MKHLLQTLTACLLLAAPAASQILTENFDYSVTSTFPPTGWTISPGATPTWQEASLTTGMTSLVANAAVHLPSLSGLASSFLTTPTMDFSSVVSPQVVFDSEVLGLAVMAHNSGDGQSIIEASTNGGGTWVGVFDYQPLAAGLVTGLTVDLPTLAFEPSVQLRFRYRGTVAHAWGVDTVIVQDGYAGGPLLTLSAPPTAGLAVDIQGSGMTANGECQFVFSVNGAGPIVAPGVGTLFVTPPLLISGVLPLDAAGGFSFTTFVPLTLSGNTLDGHVLELQAGPVYVISNHYSATIL